MAPLGGVVRGMLSDDGESSDGPIGDNTGKSDPRTWTRAALEAETESKAQPSIPTRDTTEEEFLKKDSIRDLPQKAPPDSRVETPPTHTPPSFDIMSTVRLRNSEISQVVMERILEHDYDVPGQTASISAEEKALLGSASEWGIFRCEHPSCWDRKDKYRFHVFNDLAVHYKKAHPPLIESETFPCDYDNCRRVEDYFTRKDAYRDHLREYHLEDIPKRFKNPKREQEWLANRVVSFRWWRCAQCLTRVWIDHYGWVCRQCKQTCDPERIAIRGIPIGRSSVDYPRRQDTSGTGSSEHILTIDNRREHYLPQPTSVPVTKPFIDEVCRHSIQFQGLCTMCGKDMTIPWASASGDKKRVQINMIHDQTALRSSNGKGVRDSSNTALSATRTALDGRDEETVGPLATTAEPNLENFASISIPPRGPGESASQHAPVAIEFSHTEYQSHKVVPYTTIKQLGHGSLGSVDAVRPIGDNSGPLLARKIIRLPNMARKRLLPLIQQEVDVLRGLKHMHIVQVVSTYETTSTPRQFGILLAPAGDEDLSHFLERVCENDFPELDLDRLRKWQYCLASAVAYIHSQNIRHKDIKPSNAICKGDEIFLTDFGSAHQFSAGLTSSTEGYAVGVTKMYSAPEVIALDRRGRPADIYSLGCVFAEMMTVINRRRIEDFHDFRSEPIPDEPDRITLCYYATSHKLGPWFEDIDDPDSFSIISKMVADDQKLRPTAEELMLNWAKSSRGTICSCGSFLSNNNLQTG